MNINVILVMAIATIFAIGAWPLQANATTATLLARCGELKAELEVAHREVGQLKAQLEAARRKVGELEGVARRTAADPVAEDIRQDLLRSSGRRIGELESQLRQTTAKVEKGESRMVASYEAAGIPPIYLSKVDYAENIWNRPLAVPAFPSTEFYPVVICTPSHSSRGVEDSRLPEESQSRLAQSRCEAIRSALSEGGRQVTIAPAMEGGSAAFLMFVADGLPGYKVRELERLSYRNAGALRAVFGRLDAVERSVKKLGRAVAGQDDALVNHEERLQRLEAVSVKPRYSLGFSALADSVGAQGGVRVEWLIPSTTREHELVVGAGLQKSGMGMGWQADVTNYWFATRQLGLGLGVSASADSTDLSTTDHAVIGFATPSLRLQGDNLYLSVAVPLGYVVRAGGVWHRGVAANAAVGYLF